MTTLVKRIVNRNTENKQVGNRIEVAVSHNSAIGSADCLSVLPQIVQGGTAFTRIGDKIMPKSLRVQGVVSLDDIQADERDLYVRVIIASQKNIKVGSVVNTGGIDTSNLLEPAVGGSEEIAYSGTTSNIMDPINTELFRVYYDRTFKLCPSANQTRTSPLDRQSFRWSYKFKSLPASMTFDAGNGDWVNNFAPFFTIGYAYADGTAPDVVTTRIVSTTNSLLRYEDA